MMKRKLKRSSISESAMQCTIQFTNTLNTRLFKNILEVDYQLFGNPARHRTAPPQHPRQEWQKAADTAALSALTTSVAAKRKLGSRH